MHVQQQTQVHYVGAVASGAGCCGVPPEASCAVTGARACAIISIIVHVGALLAGGGWFFFGLYQWVASIIAFVMCGILLCVYSPCAYITAGLIFIVAAVFDMLQFFAWLYWYNRYQDAVDAVDSDDYYNFDSDSEEYESYGNVLLWFALPPLLGAITLGLGAIFAFTSACFWKDAPQAVVASTAPVAHVAGPGYAAHHSTHQPQKEYKHAQPHRAPPPGYDEYA